MKKNEGPSSEQPGNGPSPPLVHLRKIRRVCCYRNPTWVVLVYRNEELGKKCEAQYLPHVSLIFLGSEPAASRSQRRAPKWMARFPRRKDDMHIFSCSFITMHQDESTPLTAKEPHTTHDQSTQDGGGPPCLQRTTV